MPSQRSYAPDRLLQSGMKGRRSVGVINCLIYLTFVLMSVSVLMPRASVGYISLGMDDVLIVPVITALLIKWAQLGLSSPSRELTFVAPVLFFFVAVFFFVSFLGQSIHGLPLKLPTELWQYIKRACCFLLGFHYVGLSIANPKNAAQIFLIVLLIAMFIGVLPFILDGAVPDLLANVYARTEQQLERLVDRDSSRARAYGVAGHPNAWGGFAAFAVFFSFSHLLTRERHQGLTLQLLLFCMAIFNVVGSNSRGAMAAVLAAFLATGFIMLLDRRISLIRKVLMVTFPGICVWGFFALNTERANFFAYRLQVLIDERGGARVDQINAGLSLLGSTYSWLFGVSNSVQRELAIGHGIESEPLYLLVNYGVVGSFLLLIVMLYLVGVSLLLCRNPNRRSRFFGYTLFSSIMMYGVFSLSYFFFQEIVVGTTFWLFAGCAAGLWSTQKKAKRGLK